jgi:GT2 family glycosyltransferase
MVSERPNALPGSEVTIVVSPWQHFSAVKASLESIFAFTQPPFELIYIDGNSPPNVARCLQDEARKRGFTLVRTDRYLTSSEAHNIGMRYVRTEYVVFVDNCTLVTPGWLSALLRCAKETQAWVVGPLYCSGDPSDPTVYSAAPELNIIEENGKRRLHETAPYAGKRLAAVRGDFHRGPCGYVKSYCMLTRKRVVERLGAFDQRFTSYQEHRDFCLDVQKLGGSLVFEPESIVVIALPPPFEWTDLPLFFLRWSDAWLRPSISHFASKWNLPENDHMLLGGVRFRNVERRRLLWPLVSAGQRLLGRPGRRAAEIAIDAFFERVLEPTVIARLERERITAANPVPSVLRTPLNRDA